MPQYHLLILSFIIFNKHVAGEVFTALADLEDLLDTEAVLIQSLENYIGAVEDKVELLKR